MAFIKGYLFTALSAATTAVNTINEGEGIPVSLDAVTQTYCTPSECIGGYYLPFDEVTAKYLGEPVDVELITPSTLPH